MGDSIFPCYTMGVTHKNTPGSHSNHRINMVIMAVLRISMQAQSHCLEAIQTAWRAVTSE